MKGYLLLAILIICQVNFSKATLGIDNSAAFTLANYQCL
jgi:hypothetical protein